MSGTGEVFLGAIIQPLIKQLESKAFKLLTNHKEIKSSFRKLSGILILTSGVLEDAEEKQYTEKSVKQWVALLRDAAYDLEDLLDEIKTQAEIKRSWPQVISQFLNIPSDNKMMSKIEDITGRLQYIWEFANILKLTSGGNRGSGYGNRNDVTSVSKPHMLEDVYVVGRDEKKKEIIDMVCGSRDDLLVLPIVGMGGIGKTTLAKSVYYDTEVQKHFPAKAMATVSTEFHKLEVTKSIYYQVTHKQPEFPSLDILQGELRTELVNKKFLIVLDDVWNDKSEDWENLICPFKKCQSGSVIIVTTRSEEIAKKVNPHLKPLKLELLNEEDCLKLMLHHAQISFNDTPEFEDVAKKLMRRCGRLPLAARALGGILVSKRKVEEWEWVLNHKMWELKEDNILPVLRLSYFDLPSHLKRMFAYCSIFPQDYVFDKKQLVLLWMGEGFLDQHADTDMPTKEDWGYECFDELVIKSFFQYSSLGKTKDTYVMHDLVNDLAHSIAAATCDHWKTPMDTYGKTPLEKVRHCSILIDENSYGDLMAFPPAKRLRSLVLISQGLDLRITTNMLPDLLPKLRHIRVLSLRDCFLGELPDSICELTHLRYLDLSGSNITTLPNSLDRLIWLETLSISGCGKISCLPKTLGNLCHLRHLDNSGTDLKYLPFEIGKLEHLQTLSEIVLSKEGGFGLKELRNLKNLGGSLTIRGLENVTSVEGVEECLKLKKNLHELILEWNMRNEFISAEDVLECLHRPRELRELKIKGFYGSRFPKNGIPPNLELLYIRECPALVCLPDDLSHLNSCTYLHISRCDKLVNFAENVIPPNLECLRITQCPALVSLPDDLSHLNSCTDLQIWRCDKLVNFPENGIPPNLEHLYIIGCPALVSLPNDLSHLNSCTELRIERCDKLVNFAENGIPPNLKKLYIEDCPALVSLPDDLSHLNSCIDLWIEGCDKLVNFAENGIPPNLKELYIEDCPALVSLPDDLSHLNSCEYLRIERCDKLVNFAKNGIPPNLEHLYIIGCPALVSLLDDLSYLNSCTDLVIGGCDKLVKFPENGIPPNLKRLYIIGCPALVSFSDDLSHLNSCTDLRIEGCDKLVNFAENGIPPNLKNLRIIRCPALVSLPDDLSHLNSCKDLRIDRCDKLLKFPENGIPPNLEHLYIIGCPALVSLPDDLNHLNSCTDLRIEGCDKLVKFPENGIPPNLKHLYIIGCPALVSLPDDLSHLNSYIDLHIERCDKLVNFAENDIPPNLKNLRIT